MLMADHMKLNAVDEALLLYVDNELSESETVQFEQRLLTDQNLQLQYQLLLKTKLQPSLQFDSRTNNNCIAGPQGASFRSGCVLRRQCF
jgi:hypothetical protein